MTQIKPMMSFIKKEFLHIFRDWRTILILVLMPIAQILLFGFALSSDIKDVKYAIFNPANSEFSGKILSHLESSGYFKKDSIITDFNNIFTKNIDVAFIFPSDFSSQNPRMQILLDASDPNRASTINMQASGIFLNALSLESNMPKTTKINLNTTMLFNPESKSALSFVPGLIGMLLMLICAMMTSISIVKEKELGSMEILLTCPMKPIYVIISKIIPYFLLSIFSALLRDFTASVSALRNAARYTNQRLINATTCILPAIPKPCTKYRATRFKSSQKSNRGNASVCDDIYDAHNDAKRDDVPSGIYGLGYCRFYQM